MKLAIMQPYFFPYIGYFQLMNAVDEFIVYDNIEYTKKGWINRNRILVNGADSFISLPLKKDSDYLTVIERSLAETWPQDRKKLLNRIAGSYNKAPYLKTVYPLLEEIMMTEETNLFQFIYQSLVKIKDWLGINTTLLVSSGVNCDHSLKGEDKVLALCKSRNADTYINPIGGTTLYNKDRFAENDLALYFLRSKQIEYHQYNNPFVPWLSIIDVLMFNSNSDTRQMLQSYNLE